MSLKLEQIPSIPLRRPWCPQAVVCARGNVGNNGMNSNDGSGGANLSVTGRMMTRVLVNSFDPCLVYGNFALETIGANNITIRAGIEYPARTFYPVTFSGQRDVTIQPGQLVVSDPVPIELVQFTRMWVRTRTTVASGTYPWACYTSGALGEGRDTTGTDLTTSGTISPSASLLGIPGPNAVIGGTLIDTTPVIALYGDSIAWYANDTYYTTGWMERALEAVGIPYINCGTNGDGITPYAANRSFRTMMAGLCHAAISEYGVNNFHINNQSYATAKGLLDTYHQSLVRRHKYVYQTTITPDTTSTDSWATTGNQTAFNSSSAAGAAKSQLNDYIRTVPNGLTGIIEASDAVSSARNSEKWSPATPALTADGLHPANTTTQTAAFAALQATIPTAQIANNFGYIIPTAAPTSPSTRGLLLRFRADSVVGLADAASVTNWTDSQSGVTISNTGVSRPIYKAGILNQKPVIRFSGSQSLFATGLSLPFTTSAWVVAVVNAPTGGITNATIFELGTHGVNFSGIWMNYNGASNPSWRVAANSTTQDNAATYAAPSTNVITGIYGPTSGSQAIYIDGSSYLGGNFKSNSNLYQVFNYIGAFTNPTWTDLSLGKLNSGSFGGQVDIAELLIYNVEPTAAELQQTMQYVNNYWDIF